MEIHLLSSNCRFLSCFLLFSPIFVLLKLHTYCPSYDGLAEENSSLINQKEEESPACTINYCWYSTILIKMFIFAY